MPDGSWEEHSAVLGFTQLNTAHDGVSLGKALYGIIARLGFGHKVCITYYSSAFRTVAHF